MNTPNHNYTIIMFDDSGNRQNLQILLEELSGYTVNFIDLKDKNVIEEMNTAKRKQHKDPDLVLVDYILDKTSQDSKTLMPRGTSLADIIRGQWPACPIIALTAAYKECVNDIAHDVFDDIVPLDNLSKLVEFIPSIIEGYQTLKTTGKSLDDLFSIMIAPENQRSELAAIVPEDVKISFGKMPICAHRVFRWFRKEFFPWAGPLYDRRWASVLLGVDEEQFERYQPSIESAKYNGIFNNPDELRWWKASIYEAVLPDSTQRFSISIQQAACEELNINEEHFSKCYKCHEKWPEVLAYVDEGTDKEMHPMHLRCTCEHSCAEIRPFYEERRVMLGEGE